jgi:hypothetical protein
MKIYIQKRNLNNLYNLLVILTESLSHHYLFNKSIHIEKKRHKNSSKLI